MELRTLAFIDLDGSTAIEDLVAIGAKLRTDAGPDGFVARYGGAEFVVVLPRMTARQLADVVDGVVGTRRNDGTSRPRVGVAFTIVERVLRGCDRQIRPRKTAPARALLILA